MNSTNNNSNNSSSNSFYLAFKDQFPCWPLIVSASAFGLIAIIGISLNISVIYVTAKSKSLRSSANYLLALTSLFEILHQHGHFLFVYTAFSGQNFIDFRLAIHLETLSLFGLFALNLSMFFTGLDRFICFVFPILWKQNRIGPYLGLLTLLCFLVGTYITVLFYAGANQMPFVQITGTIGDLLEGSAGAFYTKYALCSNAMTILIYVITGLILRSKSKPSYQMPIEKIFILNGQSVSADAVNRRIFRSLFAIILCNVGGYFIVAIFLVFVAPRLDPITMWFIRTVLGCAFLNSSASSNAPILYVTSSEYRKAYQKHFPFLFCWRNNSVSPTNIARNFRNTPILTTSRQFQSSTFA